ncbi:hypothetical protein K456DRAFT_55106 [Colletotrichum gloeosporioides 23]|nr:hypothetical protein K456DRAFT_55106 [Colletotrichum gloeosporioides 23]
MDSLEGSANDVMTAEIDRRDQMTQLLTALNGLISTDRATPTLLASSVPTLSTANMTIQAISNNRMIAFIGKRKEYIGWSQQMWNKIRLDKRFIGSDEDIWYYINACLDYRPQQVMATFYAAGAEAGGADWPSRAKITLLEGALSVKLRKALVTVELPLDDYHQWLLRDNHKYFNYNQISYIAVWCLRLKRSYPVKAKKVKKVKKAARPKESSSSTIEELGSSETEESLGKE